MGVAVPAPVVYEYKVGAGRALRLSGLRYAECDGDARGGALAAAGHATGAAQWPAGTLLCDYLSVALGQDGLRGARVVELGCGLGMCGIVAAALAGPSGSVLLTDGDAGCVAFAAANVADNADAALDAPCATALLRWGDEAADERAASLAPGPAVVNSLRSFDICLGGDLIYDDTSSPARIGELVATVDNLLSRAPHAQFLLGFQRRSVPLARLLGCAAARGLRASLPAGGYVEDLFGNRTEEFSHTWQLCLLRFTRDTPAAAEASAAELVAEAEAASSDAF